MENPRIFRIRFIPEEKVDISKDEVVHRDEELMITRWIPIHPRADFIRGISYTFMNEGWKISRFMDDTGKLLYWYCDIIYVDYDKSTDTYNLYDLLIDIKIEPDGKVTIMDLDELAVALKEGIISQENVYEALIKSNKLMNLIYANGLEDYIKKNLKEKKWDLVYD